MVIPNEWVDGYAREETFKSTGIVDTNATTYKFGRMGSLAATQHPSPIANLEWLPTAVNKQEVASGRVLKTMFTGSGIYPVGFQNGCLFQWVMGKSVTVDDSPGAGYNTHTITPPTSVAGILPPLDSFTLQHEKKSVTTDYSYQWKGCKVFKQMLQCTQENRYLMGEIHWLLGEAEKVGFQLTNAPALPATANTDPYLFDNTTFIFDVGGTPVDFTEYVKSMEFEINTGLEGLMANNEVWTNLFIEGFRKDYTLTIDYIPFSDAFFDELISTTNTKEMSIKFTRHNTNDYIQLNLTNCWFSAIDTITPKSGEVDLSKVTIQPEALSITVVDQIEKERYGE